MAEIYLGDTKISSGESGGGSYDDTELSNRVSALESIDHSKYLTEHQSLAGYYTKTQVDDIVGNIDTALQNIING